MWIFEKLLDNLEITNEIQLFNQYFKIITEYKEKIKKKDICKYDEY